MFGGKKEDGGGPSASDTGAAKKPVETEGKWARWGRAGFDKSIKISDWISPYANSVAGAVGGQRFWPQSNDFPLELEKCERILRAFTVEGIQQKEVKEESVQDANGTWIKKKVKVLRKIPPAAIRNAKGIAIYSSMRSGIAPLGGGGGSGVFLARLPNGSWSAPSAISPQNGAVGLLLGIDFLDVVLLINSEKTMETFKSHRIDLGAETGITAGPYGTGASAEASYDKTPIYSYVRNRGAYAGVELLGQVFLHRFDENERFYYWPGISAGDILTGKVRTPPVVFPLHRALRDAESGRAQGGKLERTEFDIVKIPESEVFKHLNPNGTESPRPKRFVAGSGPASETSTPKSERTAEKIDGSTLPTPNDEKGLPLDLDLEKAALDAEEDLTNADQEDQEFVRDGERLRLPPTPAELEMMEAAGIPDDEDLRVEREERIRVYQLPPPPMHADVKRHWDTHPNAAKKRPTEQLIMDGPHGAEFRRAQFTPLPQSPRKAVIGAEEEHNGIESRLSSIPFEPAEAEAAPREEILAQGVEDEQQANEIMRVAVAGNTEKAKEIGQEQEEKEAEQASDEIEALRHSNGHADEEDHFDEAMSQEGRSSDVEVVTTEQEANPAETNSTASLKPVTTVDTSIDADDMQTSTDHLSSPRVATPTEGSDTGTATPSGVMTPSQGPDHADQEAVGNGIATGKKSKATPTRPPRRKRPPKNA